MFFRNNKRDVDLNTTFEDQSQKNCSHSNAINASQDFWKIFFGVLLLLVLMLLLICFYKYLRFGYSCICHRKYKKCMEKEQSRRKSCEEMDIFGNHYSTTKDPFWEYNPHRSRLADFLENKSIGSYDFTKYWYLKNIPQYDQEKEKLLNCTKSPKSSLNLLKYWKKKKEEQKNGNTNTENKKLRTEMHHQHFSSLKKMNTTPSFNAKDTINRLEIKGISFSDTDLKLLSVTLLSTNYPSNSNQYEKLENIKKRSCFNDSFKEKFTLPLHFSDSECAEKILIYRLDNPGFNKNTSILNLTNRSNINKKQNLTKTNSNIYCRTLFTKSKGNLNEYKTTKIKQCPVSCQTTLLCTDKDFIQESELNETYDELAMLFSQQLKQQSRPCKREYCLVSRLLRQGRKHDRSQCCFRFNYAEFRFDQRPACSSSSICRDTYDEYKLMHASASERKVLYKDMCKRRKEFLHQPCENF